MGGGWTHTAKHTPVKQNVLADDISRCPRHETDRKVRELRCTDAWSERPIGKQGQRLFYLVLGSTRVANEQTEMSWNLIRVPR